jgi:YggT family protein
MQWQRISFRNPIGQFVVATTDWLVLPLRRFIPGLGGLDLASLLPAWVVQVLVVLWLSGARDHRCGRPAEHAGGDVGWACSKP